MQKNSIFFLICLLAASLMAGCTAGAEQRTGESQGYGGVLRVTIRMNGSDITDVTVTEHSETQGVGTRAIDALPDAIVEADTPEVDHVSGATVTSKAIIEAVRQAIGTDMNQDVIDMNVEANPAPSIMEGVLSGVGMAANGRFLTIGENSIPALNVVFAAALFDEEGRILHVDIDQLELFSPAMTDGNRFSGFPQENGAQDDFLKEAESWVTKGAMGEDYSLPSGSWREQMDAYQKLMLGKTVAEIHTWHDQSFDPETKRPLTEGAADITSQATISLTGDYGNILLALDRAWEDAQSGNNMQEPETSNPPADVTNSGSVGKLSILPRLNRAGFFEISALFNGLCAHKEFW